MGAFEKAKLEDKYGWTGKKYGDLMGLVVSENYDKISNAILTTDKRRFARDMKKLIPEKESKLIILPDVSNVIRRSPTIRKSADRGELLAVTMREEMRKLVKRGLVAQNITTTRGTVRKSLSKNIEK